MKKVSLFVLIAWALPFHLIAQTHTSENRMFSIVSDDPRLDPIVNVNLDYVQLQSNRKNSAFNQVNIGLWGVIQPGKSFGVDFVARTAYSILLKGGVSTKAMELQAEVGGRYPLFRGVRKIKTNMLLSRTTERTWGLLEKRQWNDKETQTSVYGSTKSNLYWVLGPRAGYFNRASRLVFVPDTELYEELGIWDFQMNMIGAYFGMMLRTTQDLYVKSQYGLQSNAKAIEFYADVLSLPNVQVLEVVSTRRFFPDVTPEFEEIEPLKKFGWRIGFRSSLVRRHKKGTVYTRSGGFLFSDKPFFVGLSFEVGQLPHMGTYFSGAMSFPLVKISRSVDIPLE